MTGKSLARWFHRESVPWWTLCVVGLVELLLCIQFHRQRWDQVIMRRPLANGRMGEGLVIHWNGLGYYAWLRSALIDGDWDFDNEFDEHNPYKYYVPPPQYRTPLGRRANQWSVGPACIWATTVVPAHFLLKAAGGSIEPWATDGYSLPYQWVVGSTSFLVAILGLPLLYGICRIQASPLRAAMAAALVTLGTTIVYFNAVEITLPHGLGTTVFSGLVYYWMITYGSLKPVRWFMVGALVGVTALIRWQMATFSVLLIAEWLMNVRQGRNSTSLACLGGLGAVAAVVPQLFAWKCLYGTWLVNPIQGVTYHWLSPSLWEVLCSQDRSLFYWTPLTVIACIGTFGFMLSRPTLSILALAFVIQVYALAAMWGKGALLETTGNYAGVFLARSYGFRDLTESLVVLAPGLAYLLERLSVRWFKALVVLGLLLVAWNLILVSLYTNGMVSSLAGASPWQLLTQAAQLASKMPFLFWQSFAGSVVIGVLLFLGKP